MINDDAHTTLQELKDMVTGFEVARDWQNASPQSIAISLCLEAAELLEHFQWDQLGAQDKQAMADELADVVFNCLNFSRRMDIDITNAFKDKFKRLEQKYPLDIFGPGKDNPDDYYRTKRAYRQPKTKP